MKKQNKDIINACIICFLICFWTALNISCQRNYFSNQNVDSSITRFYLESFFGKGSLNLIDHSKYFKISLVTQSGIEIFKESWTSSILFIPSFLAYKTLVFLSNQISNPDCYYIDYEQIRIIEGLFLLTISIFNLINILRELKLTKFIKWSIFFAFLCTPMIANFFYISERNISFIFFTTLLVRLYLRYIKDNTTKLYNWFFLGTICSLITLIRSESFIVAFFLTIYLIHIERISNCKKWIYFGFGIISIYLLESIRMYYITGFLTFPINFLMTTEIKSITSRFEIINFLFSPYGLIYLFPAFLIITITYVYYFYKNLSEKRLIDNIELISFFSFTWTISIIICAKLWQPISSVITDSYINLQAVFIVIAMALFFEIHMINIKLKKIILVMLTFFNIFSLLQYYSTFNGYGIRYDLWNLSNIESFIKKFNNAIEFNSNLFFNILTENLFLLAPYFILLIYILKLFIINNNKTHKLESNIIIYSTMMYFVITLVSGIVDTAQNNKFYLTDNSNQIFIKKDIFPIMLVVEDIFTEFDHKKNSAILYNQTKTIEDLDIEKSKIIKLINNSYDSEISSKILSLLSKKSTNVYDLKNRCN